jgi:hypothetical protein
LPLNSLHLNNGVKSRLNHCLCLQSSIWNMAVAANAKNWEFIDVAFNFKFNVSLKMREHKMQYTGLRDPNTICHGASCSSFTLMDLDQSIHMFTMDRVTFSSCHTPHVDKVWIKIAFFSIAKELVGAKIGFGLLASSVVAKVLKLMYPST